MNIDRDEETKESQTNQAGNSRPALTDITNVQNQPAQAVPFFDIDEVNIPSLIESPSMSQASEWTGLMNSKTVQSQLAFLSIQEQMNHHQLFDRYNYFVHYHMQTLGKLKFKYTAVLTEKLKPESYGKYLTNLLPMEADSDFFVVIYREIARIQVIVDTYVTDYFIRQRFNIVHEKDKQMIREVRQGRHADSVPAAGFAGYPSLSYLRKIDQQQKISSAIMSHLNFVTFQYLDLDENVYRKRLSHELNIWNHKQDMSKSPHKLIRLKAAKIQSPFIAEQEDLIKFKKEQRYASQDKEVTKKDLTTYLKRL